MPNFLLFLRPQQGQTLLHMAGSAEAVRLLREQGANVTEPDSLGCTPFHTARNQSVLNALLDALPNAKAKARELNRLDQEESSPLGHALQRGDSALIEALTAHGAKLRWKGIK